VELSLCEKRHICLWATSQARLSSEQRLARAADLDFGNHVVRRFLPDPNRRFGRTPGEATNTWRSAPSNLGRIYSFPHERSVSNDNVVQWDSRLPRISPQPKRLSFGGAKVKCEESLDGEVAVYYGNTNFNTQAGKPNRV
jgi:hypothetical protein